jgi:hypothetical protein
VYAKRSVAGPAGTGELVSRLALPSVASATCHCAAIVCPPATTLAEATTRFWPCIQMREVGSVSVTSIDASPENCVCAGSMRSASV